MSRDRRLPVVALATVAVTAVGVGALGAGVASATAETQKWGYEQITPADSDAIPINGVGMSKDMSTLIARTTLTPMAGMPSDGRGGQYSYAIPRTGASPWTLGPIDAANGSQINTYVEAVSADGSRAVYLQGGARMVDAHGMNDPFMGAVASSGDVLGTASLDVLAWRGSSGGAPVYLGGPGKVPVQVSVDNDGNPMTATALGGGVGGSLSGAYTAGALSPDASSVIFTSTAPIAGNPTGVRAVYRRTLTPGAQQTFRISGVGAAADYRWATANQQRIFFVSDEALEPGDTDGQQDLYMREGTNAPVRISQGEMVDGMPTGNRTTAISVERPEWAISSEDGNRTYFVTAERLTQDAPAGINYSLYERDLAEGRTRFVASLGTNGDSLTTDRITGPVTRDPNARSIRVTPTGVVFSSKSAHDGAPADGKVKAYVWSRDGGVKWISRPDADAPPTPAADISLIAQNGSDTGMFEMNPLFGGRAMSDDGSRMFFATTRSLTADDTDDGYKDVYTWTADEGVRLVTPPGNAPYHATYVDNSPDGTEVVFNTNQSILPGDTDPNATDVYVAILGGGAAPGKPAPDADPTVCTGDACQRPVTGPLPLPGVGSAGFVGHGNVLTPSDPAKASLTVAKPKVASGTKATLRVKVSERGTVRVSGSGLARTAKTASKAATYSVAVKLSPRARRTLKRKHRVTVRATVRLTPQRGSAVVKRVSVTFKQAKAGKKAPARAGTAKGGR